MWIFLWILMFFLLVLLHELWHFTAAKKLWVKVLEFWIWIPPKITKIFQDKSWTKYTLNLLPFWWFVRLKWDDPSDKEDFNARDSFMMAKLRKKTIILLAWVFMNLIIAWILFIIIFTKWTQPITILPNNAIKWNINSYLLPTYWFLEQEWYIKNSNEIKYAKIEEFEKNSLLKWKWLNTWDYILSINNKTINSRTIWKYLEENIWKNIKMWYLHNWKTWSINIQCPKNNCILWVSMWYWNLNISNIKFPLWKSIIIASNEIYSQTKLTFMSLWILWKWLFSFNSEKTKASLNKLTWPVWIIKVWDKLLSIWWIWLFLAFWWIISLALAIFNVLPIPALDWWRLLSVIIQNLFKIKPEKYYKIENYINIVFFSLIMILWIYIVLKDLIRFRWINIPFIS